MLLDSIISTMWSQEVGEDIPTVLASEKVSEAVVNMTDVTFPGGRGQISPHWTCPHRTGHFSHHHQIYLPDTGIVLPTLDLSSIHFIGPPNPD